MGDEIRMEEFLQSVDKNCAKLVERGHEYVFIMANKQNLSWIGSNKGKQFLDTNTELVQKFFEHCYNATAAVHCVVATELVDAANKEEIKHVTNIMENVDATEIDDAAFCQLTSVAACSNYSNTTEDMEAVEGAYDIDSRNATSKEEPQVATHATQMLDPISGELIATSPPDIEPETINSDMTQEDVTIQCVDATDKPVDATDKPVDATQSTSKMTALASVGLVSRGEQRKGRPRRQVTKRKMLIADDTFTRNTRSNVKKDALEKKMKSKKECKLDSVDPEDFVEGQIQTDVESLTSKKDNDVSVQIGSDLISNSDEEEVIPSDREAERSIQTSEAVPFSAEIQEYEGKEQTSSLMDMAGLRAWYDKFLRDYKSGKLTPVNKYTLRLKQKKTKRVKCQICKLTYLDEKKLKNHLVVHSGIKTFRCSFCNAKFFYSSYLTTHVVVCKDNPNRLYNPTKKQIYRAAGKLMVIPSPYEQGMMTHIPVEEASSTHTLTYFTKVKPEMKGRYTMTETTKQVLKEAHEKALENKNNPKWKQKDKLYQCTICENVYTSFRHLKRHVVIHTEDRKFTCYFCTRKFFRLEDMKDHVLNYHFRWSKLHRKQALHSGNTTAASIRDFVDDDEDENNDDEEDFDQIKEESSESEQETKYAEKRSSDKTNTDRKRNVSLKGSTNMDNQALVSEDICEDCGETFSNVRELRKHRLRHKIKDKGVNFVCNFCDKIFSKEESMDAHRYVCQKKLNAEKLSNSKGPSTNIKQTKGKHRAVKNSKKQSESVNNKRKSGQSSESAAVSGKEKSETGPKEVKTYDCKVCLETFFEQHKLVWHQITVHGVEALSNCPLCDKEMQKGSVTQHLKKHKTFDNIPSPSNLEWLTSKTMTTAVSADTQCLECNRCDFTCQNLDNLWRHQAQHVEEQVVEEGEEPKVGYKKLDRKPRGPGQCTICGKYFTVAKNAERHYKTVHCNERNIVCELCGKAFKTMGCLQLHSKTHNKELHLVHACEVCGKKFMKPSRLKMHRSVHTKEKAYMCEHCGKTFRMQANLIKHKHLVHTTIRSYKCELCEKSFKMRENWRNHMRRHVITDGIDNTGNKYGKVFECEKCGKQMSALQKMRRHLATHNKQSSFECQVCSNVFSQKNHLKEHMQLMHNVSEDVKSSAGSSVKKVSKTVTSNVLSGENNPGTTSSMKMADSPKKIISRLKIGESGKIVEIVADSGDFSSLKLIEHFQNQNIQVQDLGVSVPMASSAEEEVVQTEPPDNLVLLPENSADDGQPSYYMLSDGHDDEQSISVLFIPSATEGEIVEST